MEGQGRNKSPVLRLTFRVKAEESPLTPTAPSTSSSSTTAASMGPVTMAQPPATTAAAPKPSTRPAAAVEKIPPIATRKIVKAGPTSSSGSSFFGKLAQSQAIPKTPLPSKPIPLKKYRLRMPS